MTIHGIKTEIHLTNHTAVTAEFLSNMIQFWHAIHPQVEKQEAIPRTRDEWVAGVERLAQRGNISDSVETARGLREVLSQCQDFTIHQSNSEAIVVEFSTQCVLTMTADPLAEDEHPIVH